MADPAKKGVHVEEDDEFEEFAIEDWNASQAVVKNPNLWDSSWDQDDTQDRIGQQLRAQLANAQQGETKTG
eukprot:CAMPEP_0202902578 /NCGR_PEP_ID=MMETSP1392-20130828/16932_1 /ASSEMBLY_ACC=CAM_ASM_000868 /TAXON_ID=225041 /ORGANISM="Chlamydomonas chlamydogama, Strain SAG 11-48b" /LENGTH=70 /DNA_ID=CAMNT_0049589365 /DNA_START=197 /DNA_END=409 /DNA_ORIENTATION=+